MITIIPTIKYGSTYYNAFAMEVCSNYHGYFFQRTMCYTIIYDAQSVKKYNIFFYGHDTFYHDNKTP